MERAREGILGSIGNPPLKYSDSADNKEEEEDEGGGRKVGGNEEEQG